MRIFIKKILLFAGFLILLAILVQAFISILISGRSLTGHDNLEQTSNVNADLVFLGSSRCWVHFDPRYFDSSLKIKCLNIGVDGHSEISMTIVRLKDYLSRNKPPKYAIYNFDPFITPGSETDNYNFVHKDDFARYAFLPKMKDRLVIDYFKFNVYEKYIPLYSVFKYRILETCLPAKKMNDYMLYGYERHDEQWDTIAKPVSGIAKPRYFDKDRKGIDEITVALNKLKSLCSDNNIKLICVQTPVYKIIHDDSAFANTKEICRNLNISFADMDKDFLRNNIRYFYNPNHLNVSGIAEMNRALEKDSVFISFLNQ
jgi:hypothetical protein